MKKAFLVMLERVDAATLRERVMIFAAAALVLVALLNALLIEPELAKQKRLAREVAQRQNEVRELQTQLQKLVSARQGDPDQAARRRLAEAKERIAQLDAKLAEEQRKFVPPEKIGALLEEMLSRNRKLQLVDMRTLPAAVLAKGQAEPDKVGKPAPATAPATPAPKPAAGGQIYRHGVEITVTGAYLDLLAYLADLEKLPNQMYWGRLELNVGGYPQGVPQVTLKLSVYTLSLDLAWLVV